MFKKKWLGIWILTLFFCSNTSFGDCGGIKLLIMRHGEGEHMLESIRNSSIASPPKHLTRLGYQQAIQAAKNINLSKKDILEVTSSPLQRTLETAAVFFNSLPGGTEPTETILSNEKDEEKVKLSNEEKNKLKKMIDHTPIRTHSEIIERNFGPCEGTPILRGKPEDCYNQLDDDGTLKKFKAESDEAIKKRATSFLNELSGKYCHAPFPENGKYVVVATHDVTAKQIIKIITDEEILLNPGEMKILNLDDFSAKGHRPSTETNCVSETKNQIEPATIQIKEQLPILKDEALMH
jgi:broad specificity phosphatase PhoE